MLVTDVNSDKYEVGQHFHNDIKFWFKSFRRRMTTPTRVQKDGYATIVKNKKYE